MTEIRYINLAEVRRITGMGTTFIYARMKSGEFPKQVRIGGRAARWVESEVQEWSRQRLLEAREEDTAA